MSAPTAVPSPLFDRVSRSVYWNTVLLPVVAASGMLTSVLVRRGFGLASGGYDVLLGLVSTILFYSSFGIPSGLMKTLPEREIASGRRAVERLIARAFSVRFAILALFLVALNVFAAPIADRLQLGAPGVLYLRMLGALVAARAVTDIVTYVLNAFLAQREVNLLIITQSLLDPLFIAVALSLGYGIGGLVAALSASTGIVAIAGATVAFRMVRRLPETATPRADMDRPAAAWKFSLFEYVLELARYFGGADYARTALGAVLPHGGVAIFSVGFYLAFMVVNLIASIFRGIYRPMFTRLRAEGGRADVERAFLAISKIQLALLVPAAVGLVIMAGDYVPLLYGETFRPAIIVARILVVLLVTETAFNQAQMILANDERYAVVLGAVAIQLAAAALLVVAAELWSVEMAALALGLGRATTSVVCYLVCRRLYGLPYPWLFLAKLGAASAAMAAVLCIGRWLWATSLVEAATLTAAGAVVFALGVRALGIVGEQELALFRRANLPGGRWLAALVGAPAEAR